MVNQEITHPRPSGQSQENVEELLRKISENTSKNKGEGQRVLNFRETLQPLTEVNVIKQIEKNGELNQITLHFPAGCNALVSVRVFVGSEAVLPVIGYIALDDATTSFYMYQPIKPYDPVRVEIQNHDDTWEHTISVIIAIKSVE